MQNAYLCQVCKKIKNAEGYYDVKFSDVLREFFECSKLSFSFDHQD